MRQELDPAPPPRPRTSTGRTTLALALLLAVTATSCSSGATEDRSQPETPPSQDSTDDPGAPSGDNEGEQAAAPDGGSDRAEADAVAFAECMREQGIDYPDPILDPDGNYVFDDPQLQDVPAEQLDAAMEACGDLLPRQTTINDPAALADWLDASVEWSECMRDHDQPVPDPQLNSESEVGAVEVNPDDKNDPAFEAAAAECDDVLRNAEHDIRDDPQG